MGHQASRKGRDSGVAETATEVAEQHQERRGKETQSEKMGSTKSRRRNQQPLVSFDQRPPLV